MRTFHPKGGPVGKPRGLNLGKQIGNSVDRYFERLERSVGDSPRRAAAAAGPARASEPGSGGSRAAHRSSGQPDGSGAGDSPVSGTGSSMAACVLCGSVWPVEELRGWGICIDCLRDEARREIEGTA